MLDELIERLAQAAHDERKAMLESARRSIGQRIRFARENLVRLLANKGRQ